MNSIDIGIYIALALSLFFGFKEGLIRQLGALVGIIVGIILANAFSAEVAQLLGIGGKFASAWGYAIIFIVCLIGVSLISRLLRKVISAVGLGLLDRIGGAVVSLIKCVLLLAIVLSLFGFLNESWEIVDSKTTDESKMYVPITSTSKYIMPAVNWVGDQIPTNE